MPLNYFEELLNKPSLFKAENTLDINYIPKDLPFREKEISLLSQLFINLIRNPNSISRKILITGRTGIGKTVTVKLFGELLKQAANNRNIPIQYIHINCRKERTSYKVLIGIIRKFQKNFPKRGYSPQDLLEIIQKTLKDNDTHLFLVLDELSYIIKKDSDFLYSLTRLYDDKYNIPQRISIIGIVREISFLNNLDRSTLSTLQRNIIKFDKYSENQIFEILRYRSNLSFKDGVISKDIIKALSKIIYDNGDIRYGLNILWKAGKIAESKNLKYISPESVRLANKELVPYSIHDIIKYMERHKLIFLLSIITTLKKLEKPAVSISEINEYYSLMCENLNRATKSNSQIWNYIKEFERDNIITVKIKSKNIPGRRSEIQIFEIPLNSLEFLIKKQLEYKGISL
ncbi:MAG: ORC1-type DNA replication protein [Candidatus Lokiarchaeota archaeon]|nr:ORC1-type DNA replication protein [Candidatus Lokiarchaeota archaeon]MBD3198602.1 ORC1-type DNA replication protein [Candidatus Lokiarchaeota archaeon]